MRHELKNNIQCLYFMLTVMQRFLNLADSGFHHQISLGYG